MKLLLNSSSIRSAGVSGYCTIGSSAAGSVSCTHDAIGYSSSSASDTPTLPGSRLIRKVIYSGVLGAMLIGCSSTPEQAPDLTLIQPAITTSGTQKATAAVPRQALVENVDLISVDLINALSQIGGMHPAETVLQMEKPATNFGKALRTVLEQAGYGLRILADTGTANDVISHAVTKLGNERDGILNSYQIVVGDIRLKREYFEQPFGVTPSSNMFVIGANPAEITLNDELFEIASTQTADITPEEIVPVSAPTDISTQETLVQESDSETQIVDTLAIQAATSEETPSNPVPQVATQSATQTVTQTASIGSERVNTAPAELPLPAEPEPAVTVAASSPSDNEPVYVVPSLSDGDAVQTYPTESATAEIEPQKKAPLIQNIAGENTTQVVVKGNMYELGKSNFAGLLVNYSDMKKDVLIFANDSMRLGRKNKRVLSSFISDFLESSDIISVIGCSHGRTNLTNGNAVLATGRAQRVKEALMFSGIPENRIYEEGCWSPTHFDEVMPRRGVVITHKRERRNS